jgi:TRAP-type mannitol/chloroaromatic compound transport system permease small subunit
MIRLEVSKGAIWVISGLIFLLDIAALMNITSGVPQNYTLETIFLLFSAVYFLGAAVVIVRKKKAAQNNPEEEFKARF